MNKDVIDGLFSPLRRIMYPTVILENPKFARNISMVMRIMSGFLGESNLIVTTKRFYNSLGKGVKRLPREERMRGYKDVNLIHMEKPLNYIGGTPVCVELVNGAVPLNMFEHPRDAIYIFGPEDGDVSKALRVRAHHFIHIPTNHCFNLATTAGMILYDRYLKENK